MVHFNFYIFANSLLQLFSKLKLNYLIYYLFNIIYFKSFNKNKQLG